MNTIVKMTLEEIEKVGISDERLEEIKNFKNTDFSDCPKQTPEELAQFKPWYEVHPEWVTMKKADVHTKIDMDLIAWLKKAGKGYQTRLNAVLRWAMQNNCPIASL